MKFTSNMTKYNKAQRSLILAYEKLAPLPDFIRKIILLRPSYNPLIVQLPVELTVNTRLIAEEFDLDSYRSMTNDEERCAFYKRMIIDVIQGDTQKWLEIGPGADTCLSKILLCTYPDVFYWGVEVNKYALKKARKAIQEYKNASVHYGFIDENYRDLPPSIDYVLHEIFGVIASSEGVCKALISLRKRYPLMKSIPEYAETFLVPLALPPDDIIKDPVLIINRKLLRCHLPFFKCQLSDTHALLETYNFNAEIDLVQRHVTTCKVSKSGILTVIGIYIKLGMDDISTTSNQDLPNASTSWSNVGLVLPQELFVEKNYTIIILASTNLDSIEPKYEITLKYKKYEYTWNISYCDLYGEYQYLHQFK